MASSVSPPKHDLGSLRIHEGQRKGGKAGKVFSIIAALLGVVIVVAGAVFAFHSQKPVVEVAVAQKAAAGRPALLNASGYVTPRRRATIAAKITGRVTKLNFDEGMHVQEGFVLATLDDSDARRALDSAKADRDSAQAAIADFEVQLKNAELELHRAKQLLAAGVQSQETLDNATMAADSLRAKIALAKEQVAAAQARVGEAQQNVDNTVIRAPFDGIVYSLPVKQGAFVQAGELLLQEADLSQVLVRAFVDEPDVGRLHVGQKVEVTWDALPGRTWTGTVNTVPSTVKLRGSRNVGETTCVVDNHDLRLLPNVNVGVTIVVAEHQNVLTLQRDALRIDESKPYVYKIVGHHVKRQEIDFSLQNLTRVEITFGLFQGDVVALPAEESKPLFNGAAVKVVP